MIHYALSRFEYGRPDGRVLVEVLGLKHCKTYLHLEDALRDKQVIHCNYDINTRIHAYYGNTHLGVLDL